MALMTKESRDEAFTAFVDNATPSLTRTAWMLTGNGHAAEELVQAALVKTYVAWPRVRPGEALAFARRVLVNHNTDSWRKTRRERLAAEPPEQTTEDRSTVEDRDELVQLLDGLPDQQRRVVVLRYYHDMSERDVADMLRISPGSVKSAASRGLANLRDRLREIEPPADVAPDTDAALEAGRQAVRRRRIVAALAAGAAALLLVVAGVTMGNPFAAPEPPPPATSVQSPQAGTVELEAGTGTEPIPARAVVHPEGSGGRVDFAWDMGPEWSSAYPVQIPQDGQDVAVTADGAGGGVSFAIVHGEPKEVVPIDDSGKAYDKPEEITVDSTPLPGTSLWVVLVYGNVDGDYMLFPTSGLRWTDTSGATHDVAFSQRSAG